MPEVTGYKVKAPPISQDELIDDTASAYNPADISKQFYAFVEARNRSLCKKYCANNRYEFLCTVDAKWSRVSGEAVTCEWGNGSFEWMSQDLLKPSRIERLSQNTNTNWDAYFKTVLYSPQFLERWRDWRLGKRVKVPEYIRMIDRDAAKLFLWMRDNDDVPNMSQRLNRNEDEIQLVKSQIILELTKRGKLHTLVPIITISISSRQNIEGESDDIATHDLSAEDIEQREMLKKGWEQLSAEERFVLEAMKLDDRNAKEILESLRFLNISIKKGVPPEKTTEQQLYYFFRKSWTKLSEMSGLLTA